MFDSFFMAGFECASQRRRDGVRLDLLRATAHDVHAGADYRACAALGLRTIRDGLRWHRIEQAPGRYDWSSWLPMVEAAAEAGVQIIWDLWHYGFPDHRDPRDDDFPQAFADFAAEAVRVYRAATGAAPLVCPINEISFFAWAVGKKYFALPTPTTAARFKRRLVRCAIAAAEAIRAVEPATRFIWAEPLIHVAPRTHYRREHGRAETYRLAQFEAYDLLTGRAEPELGGHPALVDAVGLNFYPHNQFFCSNGPTIPMGHHAYRPLAAMLVEVWERYRKPLLIAETGAEGSAGPAWLHYVCDEVRTAIAAGAMVEGICLYPVTAYPGWDDNRAVDVGLFSTVDGDGTRAVDRPLADELARQRGLGFAPAARGGDYTAAASCASKPATASGR